MRSALRDPVGPNDRSVYVKRRLVVLLGLVAVIAAIALIIVRPGSDSGSNATNKVELPSDVAAKPETSNAKPGEPIACAAGVLAVEAVTNQGSYGAGELPELSLTVQNTGKEACVAELGTASMTFTVSSGSDDVWRSTDCQSDAASLPVVLQPGEELASESVTWDRTRSSAETCEIERDPVVAGGASYHLAASVAGVASEDTTQFLLY